MLLKTSINMFSKNEDIKSQKAGSRISHSIPNTAQHHIFMLWDLSSKFDLGLASESVKGRERTEAVEPRKARNKLSY